MGGNLWTSGGSGIPLSTLSRYQDCPSGLFLAQLERELLLCLDIFRKQYSSLPTPGRTLHPAFYSQRQIFPSSLFSTCSMGSGPPTVTLHKGPRTTPTQAQPTSSGPADTWAQNCPIPPPFLAYNPNLCQIPLQRLQPKDYSPSASQYNPKAEFSRAWQGRWGGHTEGGQC